MTALEKQKLSNLMAKRITRFINKNCSGVPYRDFIIMVLNQAEVLVRFCVRESIDGCKKNSRKADKVTREMFRSFANVPEKEWLEMLTFKDDEESK